MSRTSNDGAATRRSPSATEIMDRKRLLTGGLVQGKSGSGKTALMAEVARSVLAPERDSPQSGSAAREGHGDGGGLLSKLIRVLAHGREADQRIPGEPVPEQRFEEKPASPEPAKVGALVTGADGDLVRAVVAGVQPERREDLRVMDIDVIASADMLTPPSQWAAEDFTRVLAETLFDSAPFGVHVGHGIHTDSLLALVIANQELLRRGHRPRYSLEDLTEEGFYEPVPEEATSSSTDRLPDDKSEREEYLKQEFAALPRMRREVLELVAATLPDPPEREPESRSVMLERWLRWRGASRTERVNTGWVTDRVKELTGIGQIEWATEEGSDAEAKAATSSRDTFDGECGYISRIGPASLPQALSEGRIIVVEGTRGRPDEGPISSQRKRKRFSWESYTALSKSIIGLCSFALSSWDWMDVSRRMPGELPGRPVVMFVDRLESLGVRDGPRGISIPRFLWMLEGVGSACTGVWAATRSMEPLGGIIGRALTDNVSVRVVFGRVLATKEDIATTAALLKVSQSDLSEALAKVPAGAKEPSLKEAGTREECIGELLNYLSRMPRYEYLLKDHHAVLSDEWCEAEIPGSPWGTRRARTVPLPG